MDIEDALFRLFAQGGGLLHIGECPLKRPWYWKTVNGVK